jgi:hypothetical protein
MPIDAAALSEVDAECSTWQQGDAFVGDGLTFVHIADLARPLTENASSEAEAGFETSQSLAPIGTSIPGLVIISQTCDLIRSAADRSYAQVAALRSVEKSVLKEVQLGFRPRFSLIPGLEADALVADLDAIMTVEKSVLTGIAKEFFVRGLTNDTEVREFAECVSRRFSRFAFPDEFAEAVDPLKAHIKAKHNKQSDDGDMLRTIREIRVVAAPKWDAANPSVEFLFVLNPGTYSSEKLDEGVGRLIGKFKATGRFRNPTFRIVTSTELSAATYIASDRLDLDNLSRPRPALGA